MRNSPTLSGSETRSGEPVDHRPVVLAAAAFLGGLIGTSGSLNAIAAAGLGGLVLCLLGWRWRRLVVVAFAIVFLVVALSAAARATLAATGPVARWAQSKAVAEVVLRLGAGRQVDTGMGGPLWLVDAQLEQVIARGEAYAGGGSVMLSVTGESRAVWSRLYPGTTVSAVVRLGAADAGSSVAAWASARSQPRIVAQPSAIDTAVERLRKGLVSSVSGLPQGPRMLVPALVVGDTTAMSEELIEQFRVTGLTHLTAVSGANLTLMLSALLWLSSRVGIRGWWRRAMALVGVIGFVLLCRSEPSVLRAAAMGLVGLVALGWSGPRQGLRYLSWAVTGLLLVDPWLSRSVGFQLSVLASGGIIWWSRRWAALLASWLPGWLAESMVVPVAAQLATQPLVTAISGQVSIVGIVANLFAGPLVGPATVLGFAAVWIAPVSAPLAALFGWAAGGFAQGLCGIAALGSGFAGASITWPVTTASMALLVLACGVLAAAMPMIWVRPWLVVLLTAAMVAITLRPLPVPGWPPQAWQVVVCDVGQGDATVLSAASGLAVVVDTGPQPAPVRRCLDQLGITEVAWLVLTHPHADHVGGVAGVLSGRPVRRVLVASPQEAWWRPVLTQLPGVPVTAGLPGTVVAAGGVTLTVLAAAAPTATSEDPDEDSGAVNDTSLVMRVQLSGFRILLAGDVQETGQQQALAKVSDLSADVLLLPHHGSARQDEPFLAAVAPKLVLVSVGADNDYGHPAASALAMIGRIGAQVQRTDRNGSLAVSGAADQLMVTQQRPG